MTKKLNTLSDLKNLGLSSPKQNLLITKDTQSAKLLFEELKDDFYCLFLESSELLPYDFFSSSPVTRASRLNCFSELTKQILTYIQSQKNRQYIPRKVNVKTRTSKYSLNRYVPKYTGKTSKSIVRSLKPLQESIAGENKILSSLRKIPKPKYKKPKKIIKVRRTVPKARLYKQTGKKSAAIQKLNVPKFVKTKLGSGVSKRKANSWISHVKAHAKKHHFSYKQALTDAKKTYKGGRLNKKKLLWE